MDVLCFGQVTADVVVNWTEEIPEKGKSEFVKGRRESQSL